MALTQIETVQAEDAEGILMTTLAVASTILPDRCPSEEVTSAWSVASGNILGAGSDGSTAILERERRDFDYCALASSLPQLKPVQQRILALAKTHEFSEREQFEVAVALEEALVNAIKHGNDSDPSKKVFVE